MTLTSPSKLPSQPRTRFEPPHDLTAPEPPEYRGLRRDGVRLLVATADALAHTRFDQLAEHLRPGDVLVVNTSGTVPGQLDGQRADGAPVVVHVANRLPGDSRVVELRSAPRAAAPVLDGVAGERISLPDGGWLELVGAYPYEGSSPTGAGSRLWRGRLSVAGPVADYLARFGRPISYGYLDQTYPIESYQTIFALSPGSAEMPSAARPFTPELATRLVSRGVVFAPITLHTGVSSQEANEGPQQEWYDVPASTAALVNDARRRGRRIVAVGTTATRALETAADAAGVVHARSGWTDLVISAARPVRVVNGLITGWHDPQASHLLLVEAVAGVELTQRAYDAAAAQRYRWHEFGDSALLLP